MLKDTGIPPMQFCEKTCVRGHRSLGWKDTEIIRPMGAKGGHMAKANIELPMFSTDINEIKIYELDHVILDLLLADKSSKRNILWATKDYLSYGNLYDEHSQIMPEQITYDNLNIIQPRVLKEKDKQTSRTKGKAEVFTPAYVCNKQLNLVDDAWFGHNNIFN